MAKAKKVSSDRGKATRKRSNEGRAKQRAKAEGSDLPTTANGKKTTAVMDRRSERDRRTGADRRKKTQPVKKERRKIQRRAKVNRRRQIDPTTCERDYSNDEIEFMSALDEYKRASGRMFPTCSEILEVLKKLGYQKRPPEESTDPVPSESQIVPSQPHSVP